jgi:hypothetical protein
MSVVRDAGSKTANIMNMAIQGTSLADKHRWEQVGDEIRLIKKDMLGGPRNILPIDMGVEIANILAKAGFSIPLTSGTHQGAPNAPTSKITQNSSQGIAEARIINPKHLDNQHATYLAQNINTLRAAFEETYPNDGRLGLQREREKPGASISNKSLSAGTQACEGVRAILAGAASPKGIDDEQIMLLQQRTLRLQQELTRGVPIQTQERSR